MMRTPNTSAERIALMAAGDALQAYFDLLRKPAETPAPEPMSLLDSKILGAVKRGCDHVTMIERYLYDEELASGYPPVSDRYWIIDGQLHEMRRAGLVLNLGGAWRAL